MFKLLQFFIYSIFSIYATAQDINTIINTTEVTRIETILSSDSMEGRKVFTPAIDKAAAFIRNEMKQVGLKTLDGSNDYYQTFSLYGKKSSNVVGVLPGKSKKNEWVIFSAHYDHLGAKNTDGTTDSIYNGANDDASGVTGILELAKYYSGIHNNERTLVFVAFTAEEIGGLGSTYFTKQIDPSKVIAMFNIEMIGTTSKWGKNSAYITGYEKTDMGEILQKNLTKKSNFRFYPDPYTQEHLFYRSDNASLAKYGIPAHTISSSKMDNEPFYHQPGDEIKTLDIENMTAIIQAIAISAETIVSGKDTPTRIKIED